MQGISFLLEGKQNNCILKCYQLCRLGIDFNICAHRNELEHKLKCNFTLGKESLISAQRRSMITVKHYLKA